MPTLGTPIPIGVTQDEKNAIKGTDGTPSDSNRFVTDSDDRVTLSDATPSAIDPDDAGSAGTGDQPSREDHQHAITADVPSAITVGATQAEGTSPSFSRADHGHQTTGAGTLAALTKEPTGFPNRADSVISFAPSPSRRFTIQPAVTSFDFYVNGVKFTKSSAETVDLTDTTGLWFIYFDAAGVLQASLTPWTFGADKAFVAIVYWNTAAPTQKLFGDERHGLVMDWQTHEYLHRVEHARYISGFPISGFVLDSDTDANVTFGLGNGQIIDEDIIMSIAHAATPTNPFEQVLSDPAEIPVLYRDGAGGNWLKDTATIFPVKNTTRINYNAESGGTWSQAEVGNNNHVAYWIFATNDPDEPIISLQGQREDNTLIESRANNGFNTLNLGALPSPEWKLLYRIIYQTGSGFGGTRLAKIQAVDDFRTAEVQPGAAAAATSHSSLADLAVGNDHPQYELKPSRTVTVATSGADASSIADAITLANALIPAPSASAPAVIRVHPGVYSTPPFTLPNYVSLIGVGGFGAVVIDASTATAALCTANGGTRIEGVTFRDASGVGGIGVDVGGATGDLLIMDCYIDDCETAIRCVGTGYSVITEHVQTEDGVTALLVNGIGANARIDGLAMTDFTTGLHIGSTGGIVTGTGLRVVDDAGFTTHIKVENASSVLAIIESVLRMDKVDFVSGAEIALSVASQTPGDEAMHQIAELHVGTHDRPRESCFGGGDSNTRTLGVLTNTNLEAGTWANITANLKFQDATSATLLAGVGVGNCCYIGGDYKFPGLKSLTTTAMALGSGSVVMEFWNGSAWTSFRHMTTRGSAPWTQYAQDLLTRVASEHIRFDTSILSTWATKALNGITKYWVRLRVVTAITTAPAADIIKNHTHRTEINSDGTVEFFGDAEPARDLVWHVQLEGRPDGQDAKDAVSDISSTLSWKGRDNEFLGDWIYGKVSAIRVQPGWDTSREMTYVFGWHPEDGDPSTGYVEIELAAYLIQPGDQMDGTKTPIFTASKIIDISTLSNAEISLTDFDFSIPTMVPGDTLVLHVYRDAQAGNADDTFTGTVIQILAALKGVVWRT